MYQFTELTLLQRIFTKAVAQDPPPITAIFFESSIVCCATKLGLIPKSQCEIINIEMKKAVISNSLFNFIVL